MSQRKTRDDFLQCAFHLIAEGRSAEAIKIDALCRQLGVSKGSFYWHFKNREALVDALLDYWSGQYQSAIHEKLQSRASGKPQAILAELVDFWLTSDMAKIDRAMRHWAYEDPRVQQAVQQADLLLLGFLKTTLRKLGHSDREARRRARLLMAVGIAEPQVSHLPRVSGDRQEVRWILDHIVAHP